MTTWLIPFRTLLKGALRDRISLFYSVIFPIGLLFGLGLAFPASEYRRQLLAGTLAISALFFSASGIAFESLAQRNRGVYKLLRATPYSRLAFVTNLTAARGVVALLSCALVATVGVLAFGISLTWQDALLLAPVLVLGTLCFTFLGLTIGNLAQNEGQAAMLNNILTLRWGESPTDSRTNRLIAPLHRHLRLTVRRACPALLDVACIARRA